MLLAGPLYVDVIHFKLLNLAKQHVRPSTFCNKNIKQKYFYPKLNSCFYSWQAYVVDWKYLEIGTSKTIKNAVREDQK